MTTLRVLLHLAAQLDYELPSLDFSTAFLQGSLHEEIWLRRPPGFTRSFLAGTQWSLRRPVYGLRQAPCEWHDTLRTTRAALEFAPSTADPSLFLRTETLLPPFYVLVNVDDLVFATADTEALALVKSELQKRHTCTDLGPSVLRFPVLLATVQSSAYWSLALSSTFGRVLSVVRLRSTPGGAETKGAGSGGAEPGGAEPGGAEPAGVEHDGVELGGAESEGAESGGAESRGAEPRGAASSGGPAGASPSGGAAVVGATGDTGAGGAGVSAGAGGTGGTAAAAGDPTEHRAAGAGGTGAGGTGAGGAGAGGAGGVDLGAGGAGGTGAGGTVRPRPYFVPLLQQVLGVPSSPSLTPPLLCPPPDQSQPPLPPASPLPAPSPYTEQSGGLTERREPASCPVSPIRTARCVPRSRPPPVLVRVLLQSLSYIYTCMLTLARLALLFLSGLVTVITLQLIHLCRL
ncbi:unnamed protein product [Closterium sp. NIES-53]